MTEEIATGEVLIHQKDVQLVRSAWHLSVDLSIKEYLASVRYIQQDLDQLLTKYPSQTPLKTEITHLKNMTELTDKIATLEQMLPGTNRSKRGILSIVGKPLKFLFGTALLDDTVRLDQKVDELKT
jgi:hypothetical protein